MKCTVYYQRINAFLLSPARNNYHIIVGAPHPNIQSSVESSPPLSSRRQEGRNQVCLSLFLDVLKVFIGSFFLAMLVKLTRTPHRHSREESTKIPSLPDSDAVGRGRPN